MLDASVTREVQFRSLFDMLLLFALNLDFVVNTSNLSLIVVWQSLKTGNPSIESERIGGFSTGQKDFCSKLHDGHKGEGSHFFVI